MSQKITLSADGVVVPDNRMKLYTTSATQPSVRIKRLQQLLRTGKPKICVIRGEGIGDLLMVTPTLHAIRQMFSFNATITVATNTMYLEGALVDVLKHNPDVDQIIERDLIKDDDYDLVINLHCPCIKYEKFGAKPPNRIDIFAQHAGVLLQDHKPRYFPTPAEIEWAEQWFKHKTPDTKTIFVQLFASSTNRSIDNRNVKEALTILYKQHGVESIVLYNETDLNTNIEWNAIPGVTQTHLGLRGIGAFIPYCDLVLCPDSSVLHLAGALNIPTVALFTSTYPGSRINHYPLASALWDEYPPCPCWYERNRCPIKQACTAGITGNRIAEACIEALKTRPKVDILQLLQNTAAIKIETEIL